MGQQGWDSDESGSPARRERTRFWPRLVAACALALTLGLGNAYADGITGAHEGGQGQDKGGIAARAAAEAAKEQSAPAEVKVAAHVEEEGIGTSAWTRTVTRTFTSARFVTSVTKSFSYAYDDEGNQAIAKAVAKARAPNNVAAVRNGAGKVTAKTSVDVTGNGAGTADAGGSIGVSGRKVEVSSWGRTSAEVF